MFFLLAAVQKLYRSNEYFQSCDHKINVLSRFFWNTVYDIVNKIRRSN